MSMDRICHNGTICQPQESGLSPAMLCEAPYLYQRMHTRAHRLLHPQTHLDILTQALEAAYGLRLTLSAEALQEQTAELLAANRYPKQGNCVTLRVYPAAGNKQPDYILECTGQLYYPQYTVWHKRLMLAVMPCEYLLMGYPTAVSRQVARYSRTVAERSGCERAVIENVDGVLTNVEDEPLLLVHEQQVFTSPLPEGATDSVMRRLILQACLREKVECHETPLTRDMLSACDEAFTASPQGLISFEGYEQARYFNLMAGRLAPVLNTLEMP